MKLDEAAEMYKDFTSLSEDGQKAVMAKVKDEHPLLYRAFKRIADRQRRERGKQHET